jgi:hypothetical protein
LHPQSKDVSQDKDKDALSTSEKMVDTLTKQMAELDKERNEYVKKECVLMLPVCG